MNLENILTISLSLASGLITAVVGYWLNSGKTNRIFEDY